MAWKKKVQEPEEEEEQEEELEEEVEEETDEIEEIQKSQPKISPNLLKQQKALAKQAQEAEQERLFVVTELPQQPVRQSKEGNKVYNFITINEAVLQALEMAHENNAKLKQIDEKLNELMERTE